MYVYVVPLLTNFRQHSIIENPAFGSPNLSDIIAFQCKLLSTSCSIQLCYVYVWLYSCYLYLFYTK